MVGGTTRVSFRPSCCLEPGRHVQGLEHDVLAHLHMGRCVSVVVHATKRCCVPQDEEYYFSSLARAQGFSNHKDCYIRSTHFDLCPRLQEAGTILDSHICALDELLHLCTHWEFVLEGDADVLGIRPGNNCGTHPICMPGLGGDGLYLCIYVSIVSMWHVFRIFPWHDCVPVCRGPLELHLATFAVHEDHSMRSKGRFHDTHLAFRPFHR
jgi:hypothetical protein